ncbi:MAG TPA: endonuclease/exonuclease/phosphatase family protein [Saprospiraceae bacterium]|nr:endonuclease/exonuclease/phosphatase family protein [Saprospiraceae bacterium]
MCKSFLQAIFVFITLFNFTFLSAQKKIQIATIGFYNVENLFDTIDTPNVLDEEFTVEGSNNWTSKKYWHKQNNLAKVISLLGTDSDKEGVAILGLAEVENRLVLEDLVKMPQISDKKYRIVHFDSPDRRGIDVALIYQAGRFKVLDAKTFPIDIYDGLNKIFTREVLYVKGLLDGEEMHFMVNHWPSRRGGEAKTAPWRAAGAKVNKSIVDSLTNITEDAKVVIMGDLNDNPEDLSITKVLGAKSKITDVPERGLFNTVAQYYRRGIGSNAYQDSWSLFDQIIISKGFLTKKPNSYSFHKAYIFNKQFLRQKKGHFKGYPLRTFSGSEFLGGYSDHFPSYIHLIKE